MEFKWLENRHLGNADYSVRKADTGEAGDTFKQTKAPQVGLDMLSRLPVERLLVRKTDRGQAGLTKKAPHLGRFSNFSRRFCEGLRRATTQESLHPLRCFQDHSYRTTDV